MSAPATSIIQMASAAAAAMLLVAGLAFQMGSRDQMAADVPGGPAGGTQTPDAAAWVSHDMGGFVPEQAAEGGVDHLIASARPVLAVIIDDIGPDRAVADALIASGLPLTLSILPFAEAAPEIARAASSGGLEVFLHLPMEPVGLADPGPNALLRSHDAASMAHRVSWALSRVPGAVGFNNHMGSAMTADDAAMTRMFEALEGRNLVFVDSLTHPRSVAASAAARAGLTALRRDVFLDHVRTPEAVDAAIEAALARALQTGSAIAIGHPHAVTISALEGLAARAEAAGVELVTVSRLANRRARRQAS